MLVKNRIMAVGNDPELLGLIQQELGNDYNVVSTQDTGSGLRDEVHQENPDFIILDIMMPNLDGIEVCLQMRRWTQTPILMLTTWDAPEGMVKGLNLCSDTYLTKAFDMHELKNRIEQTLQRNAALVGDPFLNTSTSMS